MFKKLDEVENRYEQIQQKLMEPGITNHQQKYRKLVEEMARLGSIVLSYRKYKKMNHEIASNKELVETDEDREIQALAKEEISELESSKKNLLEELKILLLPKDPNDHKNIILEIRAGAGGDEASLFAEQLLRGYSLFASKMKWKMNIISTSEGNVGGYKEVIVNISGDKVYSHMKFESGVHRVQRVPQTESQGRIHTSTVTVAVMAEVEEKEVHINSNDLRIDVYRSSGPGGQSVNTTDSAVRATHLPTGLVVTCQDGKSQLSNKEQAIKVLYARLQALEEEKARQEASDTRLTQIGTGDRSERIRTYNFPQSRITDHRIGFTTQRLFDVMDGNFAEVIEPLIAHFQAEALKQQNQNHS